MITIFFRHRIDFIFLAIFPEDAYELLGDKLKKVKKSFIIPLSNGCMYAKK